MPKSTKKWQVIGFEEILVAEMNAILNCLLGPCPKNRTKKENYMLINLILVVHVLGHVRKNGHQTVYALCTNMGVIWKLSMEVVLGQACFTQFMDIMDFKNGSKANF